MNLNKKLSIIILTAIIIITVGGAAQQFNKSNHYDMALKECGAKENIKNYDSKGFECIRSKPAPNDED